MAASDEVHRCAPPRKTVPHPGDLWRCLDCGRFWQAKIVGEGYKFNPDGPGYGPRMWVDWVGES